MKTPHTHVVSQLMTLGLHLDHLTVVEATLIAGFGGAFIGSLIGFATSRFAVWSDKRRSRGDFFQGLSRDIQRCRTIDLTVGVHQLELLNPISFPFITQLAQGQYAQFLSSEEITAVLKLHYLIQNFLRYQDPEMEILLAWIRDPENDRRREQLDDLQTQAITPLEAALRTEADQAFVTLRRKLKKLGVKAPSTVQVPSQPAESEPTMEVLQSPEFLKCMAQSLSKEQFPPPSYTPWWDTATGSLVFKFIAEARAVTIKNVPETIFSQPTDADTDRIARILATHTSGEVDWLDRAGADSNGGSD